MIVLFNKPYGVLCQFTDARGRPTLADWIRQPGLYPAGRLDLDSEGLLVLSDEGGQIHRLSHPRHGHTKTYAVQVEGNVHPDQLRALRSGVLLRDGPTRPAQARLMDEPDWLWPRDPPIRWRRNIPTQWLELQLSEGRNRQVRRMTAAVGLPTLRLIRTRVGAYTLEGLQPGQTRTVAPLNRVS